MTKSYPYAGAAEESFLDPEVDYCSTRFDVQRGEVKVLLLPLLPKGLMVGAVPKEVELVDIGGPPTLAAKCMAVFNAATLVELFRVLRDRDNSRPIAAEIRETLAWGLSRSRIRSAIRGLRFRLKGQRVIVYTYWFDGSTSGALECSDPAFMSLDVATRCHGVDLYDDRAWHPRRKADLRKLKAVMAVSEHGAQYLRHRYGPSVNLVTRYLGIRACDRMQGFAHGWTQRLHCVSCAYLVSIKRIPLLAEALCRFAERNPEISVQWTHFGDGPDSENVLRVLAEAPKTLSVDLRGTVANGDVRTFLNSAGPQLFLSVSAAEGVPVSMMEACAAGLPIVATSVGGVPEIVDSSNGELLPASVTANEVAQAVERIRMRDRATMCSAAVSKFQSRFEAPKAHGAAWDTLLAIGKG